MKPESCIGCPYYNRDGPVWGKGPQTSQLIIIGQNPWKEEWDYVNPATGERGYPFAGSAGRVLNRGCYRAGVSRDRNFVTNVVKCLVAPGERVDPLAIKKCRPLLEAELNDKPLATTILTLGQPAFDSLTGKRLDVIHTKKTKESPNSWFRGCPLPIRLSDRDYVIIPAFHPSYLMRTGFRESLLFESDIKKAGRIAQQGLKSFTESFSYNPSTAEVVEYITEIKHRGYCGLDIETPEKVLYEEEIVLRQTSTPIDVIGLSVQLGETVGVQPDQIPLLADLFLPRETPIDIYGFNLGFDLSHIATHFPLQGVRAADVMLMLNIWFSDARPKDLAMAMSLFTDLPYSKNLARVNPEAYNAYDTFGALEAGQNALKMLRSIGAERVFWEHDTPLIPIVEDLRRIGVRCDQAKASRYELQCLRMLQQYDKWWNENLPLYSWTSSKQLLTLFAGLGMPIKMKERVDKNTKERKKTPCVDEDVLTEYRDKYHSKVAGAVLHMRTLKHAGDFCNLADEDGYARSQYKIHGQKQGRLQSVRPDLQNIPEEIAGIRPRSIMIPDKDDHVFINADFDQVEMWMYAYAAQDQPLLDYKKTGEYIYGALWEEWKISPKPFFIPGKPHRKEFINPEIEPWEILLIKSGPLGLLYGRGVGSLMNFGVSKQRAEGWHSQFYRDHSAIQRHHTKRIQDAERDGYLQNLFGRIRRFPEVRVMKNEILSFDGQCNGSDVLKIRMLIPFSIGLPDFGARVVLTVHDQVLVSVPERNWQACARYMKETAESPILEMNGFSVPVSLKVGESWGEVMRFDKWEAKARPTLTT